MNLIDKPSAIRSKTMKAIRSTGTSIEKKMGSLLWRAGYRYRKHSSVLVGKPDFVFKKYRVVVFCDGEFWHGKDWEKRKMDIYSNRDFWHQKIQRNMARDHYVNDALTKGGWGVVRFWGKDIMKYPNECLRFFEGILNKKPNRRVYRFLPSSRSIEPPPALMAAEEPATYGTKNRTS